MLSEGELSEAKRARVEAPCVLLTPSHHKALQLHPPIRMTAPEMWCPGGDQVLTF